MDSGDAGLAFSGRKLSCIIVQIMIQIALESKHSVTHSREDSVICLTYCKCHSAKKKKKCFSGVCNQRFNTLKLVDDTVPTVTGAVRHQRNPSAMKVYTSVCVSVLALDYIDTVKAVVSS